jgi:formate hydrogenlyase transcriptional activator
LNVAASRVTPLSGAFASGVVTAFPDSPERDQIVRVLKETNGRVAGPSGAAARLGLKRTTLISRMKKLGINPRKVS